MEGKKASGFTKMLRLKLRDVQERDKILWLVKGRHNKELGGAAWRLGLQAVYRSTPHKSEESHHKAATILKGSLNQIDAYRYSSVSCDFDHVQVERD
ncbi:hypothetical protein ElyMa_002021900 [Elysia marginata]|uniref:Uncharacterized protein n=1 Tax=Elysia marginata TaxID=1093978 RepID=A0AAV4F5E0_9GAST|nr:hypothetical protein ElyMa_002021900 [Elysia marginata]